MSIASEITRLQTAKSDLKDAIEAKGVTVDSSATLDDYADLVASISGGGDSREDLCVSKDVDFIDYDGRLLYSYTADEFAELTELPPNPTNDGLTAQGWNWTLENAKEQVASSGELVIGQIYIPTDGKTHIFIAIPNSLRKIMCLYFGCSVANGVIVNWGDGTIETITTTTAADHFHTYAQSGNYEITIEVVNGTLNWGSGSSTPRNVTGNGVPQFYSARTFIRKIYFGNGFTNLGVYTFSQLERLEIMTIPNGITNIGTYCAYNPPALKALIMPKTFTNYNTYTFQQCYSLVWLSLPYGVTTIPQRCFGQIYELNKMIIPNTVKTLANGSFYRMNAISKVVIPAGVTSIVNESFYQCYSLKEFHLLPTTPPTLGHTNAFTGIPSDCVFYVPYSEDHSVLEAYKAATNWSTYASQMQEEDPT